VLGVTGPHGVRATATAQTAIGNTTDCLRPWAIPDKWVENRPAPSTWTADDQFQRYVESAPRGTLLPVPQDVYTAPGPTDAGTGLVRTDPAPMSFQFAPLAQVFPGRMQPLDLPGAATYGDNIDSCNGQRVTIGDQLPISGTATIGETNAGLAGLLSADSGASWNSGTNSIEGSCAPTCAPISPRLVPIALYDVDQYEAMRASGDWSGCPSGQPCVRIVNLVGFFIGSISGPGAADGYLTNYPGLVSSAGPSIDALASFLKSVTLVR